MTLDNQPNTDDIRDSGTAFPGNSLNHPSSPGEDGAYEDLYRHKEGTSHGTIGYLAAKGFYSMGELSLRNIFLRYLPEEARDAGLVDLLNNSPLAQASLHSPQMAQLMKWIGYMSAGEPALAWAAVDKDIGRAVKYSPAYIAFNQLAKTSPHMMREQELIRKQSELTIDWFIDSAIKQNPALKGLENGLRFMLNLCSGTLVAKDDLPRDYNFSLTTFGNAKDSLQKVEVDDITKLFSDPDPKKWPQLILTANHALARNENDLTSIMQGFLHEAGYQLGLGKPIEAIRDLKSLDAGPEMPDLHGKAVVVAAVHAYDNSWLNGGFLIDRRHQLEQNYFRAHGTSPEPEIPDFTSMKRDFENKFLAFTVGKNPYNPFAHISPAALILEKTILRLLLEPAHQQRASENYKEIIAALNKSMTSESMPEGSEVIQQALEISHDPASNLHGRPGMARHLVGDEEDIPAYCLRENATAIAQHIRLEGYSKGCNTVKDAIRLLESELHYMSAKGLLKLKTHSAANGAASPPAPTRLATHEDVAEIVKDIGVLSINSGDIHLNADEISGGMRSMTIQNKHDAVSGHFTHGLLPPHAGDDVRVINGTRDDQGHNPGDAFGHFDAKGQYHPGYIAKDPQASNMIRAFCSPIVGLPSVTDIFPSRSNGHFTFRIRAAAGASEEQIAVLRDLFQRSIMQAGYAGAVTLHPADHSTSLEMRGISKENGSAILSKIKQNLIAADRKGSLVLYYKVPQFIDQAIADFEQGRNPTVFEREPFNAKSALFDPAQIERIVRQCQTDMPFVAR